MMALSRVDEVVTPSNSHSQAGRHEQRKEKDDLFHHQTLVSTAMHFDERLFARPALLSTSCSESLSAIHKPILRILIGNCGLSLRTV